MRKGKAAVFAGVGQPFEIREFPLPLVESGGILVKVRMSTICGSDLHTWSGKRPAPLPIILGHEIVGEIYELGDPDTVDVMGDRLSVGDRITWTIMSSCGRCFFCRIKGLPQKCVALFKYGHATCAESPYFNGGLAEYLYIRPGTGVFKVPEELSDEEVCPINCALATVVNGLETIGVTSGDTVVIQGAGMLGLNAAALLRAQGAGKIIVLDTDERRLAWASDFGADEGLSISGLDAKEVVQQVKIETGRWGADLVVEVCGVPGVISQGVEMLRIGGRYLIVGLVFPGAVFSLDGYAVITKNITLKGIHNYDVRHLGAALQFMTRTHRRIPFGRLVASKFGLNQVDEAFEASAQKEALRVAVVPSCP